MAVRHAFTFAGVFLSDEDIKMKKLLFASLLSLSASAAYAAGSNFIIFDTSTEKDGNGRSGSIVNEYIAANVTVGYKTENKVEYSLKAGVWIKDTDHASDDAGKNKMSNNVEVKIKKSYDIGMPFTPYVAVRLGERIYADRQFWHYAFDAGIKQPINEKFAIDTGVRYRDAFKNSEPFQSTRYHATLLYDINKENTVGLRYTYSTSNEYRTDTNSGLRAYEEARETWRIHYQHNY